MGSVNVRAAGARDRMNNVQTVYHPPHPVSTGTLPNLERAVLATVAALDAFDYPPTDREVWRWLFAVDPRTAKPGGTDGSFGLTLPISFEAVAQALERLVGFRRIISRNGRYFLPYREGLLPLHAERTAAAVRKWRRARTVAEFLRLVPFVDFLGVCNNLAIENAKPEADIDVVIVVRDGHLWLARTLVTGVVQLLGLRRHADRIADRICLSFFLTPVAQDLAPLAKQPADPYLALWVAQVVPVLDRGGAFDRFRQANAWVERILPNAFAEAREDKRVGPNSALSLARNFYELAISNPILGTPLESWARSRQQARMEKHWWSRSKDGGTDVVISDLMLKFHEADRRELYRQAITERVSKVLE